MDTIDVFDILKRNGLYMAPHLVKLLKQLGYNDLYTLVQIESLGFLRDQIIDLYGSTRLTSSNRRRKKAWVLEKPSTIQVSS